MILQCNQGEALYIINSVGIAYHQHAVLHLIKPQEKYTLTRDEIQPQRGWWYAPHFVRRWYTKPAAWIKKEVTFGRQKLLLFWSRVRESNPPSRLGKPLYYRYTNPAWNVGIIAERMEKFNTFLSGTFVLYCKKKGGKCNGRIRTGPGDQKFVPQ